MKKYRVDYKVNKGEMKGKTIAVIIEGTDMEDVRARFERTSQVMAGGDLTYQADIVLISDTSKSQQKRYASQGMPGATYPEA